MTGAFGQLQFDRQLNAAPARVFAALTAPEERMAWGPPDADSVVLIDGSTRRIVPVTGNWLWNGQLHSLCWSRQVAVHLSPSPTDTRGTRGNRAACRYKVATVSVYPHICK